MLGPSSNVRATSRARALPARMRGVYARTLRTSRATSQAGSPTAAYVALRLAAPRRAAGALALGAAWLARGLETELPPEVDATMAATTAANSIVAMRARRRARRRRHAARRIVSISEVSGGDTQRSPSPRPARRIALPLWQGSVEESVRRVNGTWAVTTPGLTGVSRRWVGSGGSLWRKPHGCEDREPRG